MWINDYPKGTQHKALWNEKTDFVYALKKADDKWLETLRTAVEPIRNDILNQPMNSELADLESISLTIPFRLKLLISMLCDNNPRANVLTQGQDTICQLIMFNTKVRTTSHSQTVPAKTSRHSKSSEVPVSQYISLKLYQIVRSKELVSVLFQYGIGLSYWRVISLIGEISAVVQELYKRSGNRVLPSALRKDIFTVFIDDNVDANSASNDATSNFHGGSVTALQFLTDDNQGEKRYKKKCSELTKDEQKTDICPALSVYLSVEPFHQKSNDPYPPLQTFAPPEDFSYDLNNLSAKITLQAVFKMNEIEEAEWMSIVSQKIDIDVNTNESIEEPLSWTAHHSQKSRDAKKSL